MLAVAGEFRRCIVLGAFAASLRRVVTAASLAVGIDAAAFGVFGLGDGLFALGDLSGEARRSRLLGIRGSVLGGVNLGRVLRGRQIRELQIRRTNRHARLFHL